MKALGTYNREHKFVVDILAGMIADYHTVIEQIEQVDEDIILDDFSGDTEKEETAEVFLSTLQELQWHDN